MSLGKYGGISTKYRRCLDIKKKNQKHHNFYSFLKSFMKIH